MSSQNFIRLLIWAHLICCAGGYFAGSEHTHIYLCSYSYMQTFLSNLLAPDSSVSPINQYGDKSWCQQAELILFVRWKAFICHRVRMDDFVSLLFNNDVAIAICPLAPALLKFKRLSKLKSHLQYCFFWQYQVGPIGYDISHCAIQLTFSHSTNCRDEKDEHAYVTVWCYDSSI